MLLSFTLIFLQFVTKLCQITEETRCVFDGQLFINLLPPEKCILENVVVDLVLNDDR